MHPTGSLKHRLARSLFLYALCNGWLGPDSVVVEASSGSTAVSEAYFARLLGLRFVAVVPRATSSEKIDLIRFYGGDCHFVDDPTTVYDEAARIARESGGHYLDQFTYAERATDWRGNNNIAQSIFQQLELEPHPVPAWVVVGAGTGGTAATIGRYVRHRRLATRLSVVDPEGSAFYDAWRHGDRSVTGAGSAIEGIGRPRVEPSFEPGVIDHMARVPDAASLAAMHWCSEAIGRLVGGSTGTAVWGALLLTAQLRREGVQGSVATLICDGGERYRETYYDRDWLAASGLDVAAYRRELAGNVRRLRLARGMSLRDLAEATGSSKALLSQVERGVANPTLGVLTRVSEALDVTPHELLRSPLLAPEVVTGDWGDLASIDDVELRTLFTSFERRRLEISESAMPAAHPSSKSSHGRGSVEYAYVLDGSVVVASNGWTVSLSRGDGLRFSAEFEHVYTAGPRGARVLTVVAFTDD